jgi:nucleoside-diphosphate-sugar epimerase
MTIQNQEFWKQAAPRVLTDWILVHLAALASLSAVVLGAPPDRLADMVRALKHFYLATFLPLSPLFPLIFFWNGFYTRSRAYATRYKWAVIARGATVASLSFLFAAFLLTRADAFPRTAAVLFPVLVNLLTIGARLAKNWIVNLNHGSPANTTHTRAAETPSAPEPVLVVGGAGYIGSILCRKLLAQGRRVRLLDSFVYGDTAVRDLFGHERFELCIGDCRNIQSVVSAMKGVKSVIHLAAVVGDPACEQDRKAALEINYAATRMMMEVAKGYGVQRFLFASSCSVYGETEEIVDERSATNPISLYAQTKLDSEQALLRGRTEEFHPTILRLATVFGNSYRPRFDLVVNLLTAKAIRDRVITIFNGEQWRPFLHVADVAEGFLRVLEAPLDVVSGEIYNLGDSRLNYTLSQVAAAIQELVPGTRVEHVENPDRRNYRVSFDKVKGQLGFSCRIDLREGIRDLQEALQSRRIADYTDLQYHNQRFLKAAGRLVSKEETDSQVMAAFAATLENYQHALADFAGQPK